MFVPIKHNVDYTKSALQKQTEAISSPDSERTLMDIVDSNMNLTDLRARIDSLERACAYVRSRQQQSQIIEDSPVPLSNPDKEEAIKFLEDHTCSQYSKL